MLSAACIFNFYPPDKRRIVIIWQIEIMYRCLQAVYGMGFLDCQPVRLNRHRPLDRRIGPRGLERLIDLRALPQLDERAESGSGNVLVRYARR
ncbi:hypothetical protein D3C73_1290230 [compost metagenome]